MCDESCTPAPDPEAGQDGNGKQQLTDEERMLKEISDQKDLIDAISRDTFDNKAQRALHQKKLGQLEFKYHLLVEKKRLARTMSKFEELHGALYSEPCMICLDDVHLNASESLTIALTCCGGFICKTCYREFMNSGVDLGQCPLCRATQSSTEAEAAVQCMALAERGVSWAQSNVGRCMIPGRIGFKKQEEAGLKWVEKAAAQNDPSALHYLSSLYRDGLTSVLDKSQEKANELMIKSANLGYASANSLVWLYFTSMGRMVLERIERRLTAEPLLPLLSMTQIA
ncbi:hypothetical protein THAOC_03888 [Thalassiosira oceanica]|uniref:RING-type domain-containing protein n=1 Tax=Thalassiosira oceanica TaxID=159749 RepID=K0TBB5_THAOC|nr:hypothetical protein THAOC_03888 [Thalassiosira oceanica]|eukprot:EJK74434.1 hypothetical protein THAOC_03888 [Thalassiosira oceanica]